MSARNCLRDTRLYVDVDQLDGEGRTAAQVATTFGKHDVAALLQGLGV
jgi:hypothetical protein